MTVLSCVRTFSITCLMVISPILIRHHTAQGLTDTMTRKDYP